MIGKINEWMNEVKEKIHVDISIIINSYREKKKKKGYRSRWLNHFLKSYKLSKMTIMLGLGTVKGLTKGLPNLCTHVWILFFPKLVHRAVLSPLWNIGLIMLHMCCACSMAHRQVIGTGLLLGVQMFVLAFWNLWNKKLVQLTINIYWLWIFCRCLILICDDFTRSSLKLVPLVWHF
jgi:hypothetical protein